MRLKIGSAFSVGGYMIMVIVMVRVRIRSDVVIIRVGVM
jgi:hypothetical protein